MKERLDELSLRSGKWTPEVLSLLLELSDQPATKSNVEDLGFLKAPDPPPSPTWAQIVANDPLSDDDVWENADYSANSSDDDETSTSISLDLPVNITGTRKSSLALAAVEDKKAHAFVVPIDIGIIKGLEEAQFWRDHTLGDDEGRDPLPKDDRAAAITITELQAVREVLFLLSGLPTSLFNLDVTTGRIDSDITYTIQHSSSDAFHKLLQSFAAIATQLHYLRDFIKEKQTVAVMQTFRAAVEIRLRGYDLLLSAMEERFVAERENVVVSLIEIYAEIQPEVRPLLQLAELVTEIQATSGSFQFMVLEVLYEQTCVNQMVGKESEYAYMAELFFECFHTYIEPIRRWMEHGELTDDSDTFFVMGGKHEGGLASLWHERYTLRQDAAGKLHAPRFLLTAAKKVFDTGKSVVLLKLLGAYNARSTAFPSSEPKIGFLNLSRQTLSSSLAPFSELFDMAFENWIESKHHSASAILRERLCFECGLWRSLDALEYIYFQRDGALSSIFTTTVFNKIDRVKEAWNDRFLLTELAQGVFGSLPFVDDSGLAVRSSAGGYRDVQSRRRSVKILTSISIDYTVSL